MPKNTKQISTITCCSNSSTTPPPSTTLSRTTDPAKESTSSITPLIGLSLGITASILLLALVIIIIIASLWISIRRKAAKQLHRDHPHSTDQEGNTQSWSQANANVYEQFHLSPSTEFIPSAENEPISNIPWQPQADLQGIYSSIDAGQPKPTSQEMEEDDPMYAAVDNKEQHKDGHNGPLVLSNIAAIYDKASATDDSEPKLGDDALKEL